MESTSTLRDEEVDDLHGAREEAAAVVAEVEDEALDVVVLLQIFQGFAHLIGAALLESLEVDVARAVTIDAVVHDLLQAHLLPGDFHLAGLLLARALDLDHDFGVGRALEQLADALGGGLADVGRVDHQDAVARLQSSQGGGHAFERLRDDHSAIAGTDIGAHAAVLAGDEHFYVVRLLLRIIFGVGVEALEHGVDTASYDLLGLHRIDVKHFDFLHDRVQDVQLFADFEAALRLRFLRPKWATDA